MRQLDQWRKQPVVVVVVAERILQTLVAQVLAVAQQQIGIELELVVAGSD